MCVSLLYVLQAGLLRTPAYPENLFIDSNDILIKSTTIGKKCVFSMSVILPYYYIFIEYPHIYVFLYENSFAVFFLLAGSPNS